MEPARISLPLKPRPDVDLLLRQIVELVALCDREETKAGIPELYSTRLHRDFDTFVHAFDAETRALRPDEAAAFGAQVQATLLPLVRRAVNGDRWFSKPCGYAGDFLTIARIYDDIAEGATIVDALVDRCFLNLPAARAVQNRRALLCDEIRAAIWRNGEGITRIASLACGPARELFDLAGSIGTPFVATLIDLDDAALAHCAAQRWRLGLAEDSIQLVEANLMHIALGRRPLELTGQDLVYSIGLIDYLGDALVVKLLDYIHTTLSPGGRVIIGNFHTRNPTKAFMDHVLEWKLIHRSEDDMRRLFAASAFGACTRITYEAQRINLFAEGVKH
jgi:extracellular factor (EF) 3-hydroxypalmitic acid methyl ester biosynthesis protein